MVPRSYLFYYKGGGVYFSVFTDHFHFFPQSIENYFAKTENRFSKWFSAAMMYPFLSSGHHKSASTRHCQVITTRRSPIFRKTHYLILLASHFLLYFAAKKLILLSFPSLPSSVPKVWWDSLPTTLMNMLMEARPGPPDRKTHNLCSVIILGLWGTVVSSAL